MENILFDLAKQNYKKYNEKVLNTNYEIIGIKTQILKKIAKENINTYQTYFAQKHKYYEQYMIMGFMLGYLDLEFDELVYYIDKYLVYIDSWAMVDSIVCNLKIFKKYKEKAFILAKQYIKSNNEFTVRFGYCILLTFFINEKEEKYIDEILQLCNKKHSKYYIQMMVAWLLSVSYVKFKENVLQFMYNNKLDDFTYNKTISKICDSYRVLTEDKIELKKLRRHYE